jgi:hypothetical protein
MPVYKDCNSVAWDCAAISTDFSNWYIAKSVAHMVKGMAIQAAADSFWVPIQRRNPLSDGLGSRIVDVELELVIDDL